MRSTALKITAALFLTAGAVSSMKAQTSQKINVITTAVPFLRISPDARAGGMGDLSVATSPDASASYFNLGKIPFNESNAGVSLTYTPWLKKVVNDVYMASGAAYYKLNENEALSLNLRYFNLGEIQFTDQNGNLNGTGRPNEFGVQLGYSRKLGDKTGLGVGLKYIYSNLAAGAVSGSATYKAGTGVAGDIGVYHNGQNTAGNGISWGVALTNLGSKIAYTNNATQKDFIPANLGAGVSYTKVFDESNKIMFGLDINKLLVPTPPVTTGSYSADSAAVEDYRKKSVVGSWFSSFGDAPGGFSEELREVQISVGAEYTYNNQFSLRAGYFHESETKGNRRFFTAGVGIKYNVFGLNFSYLIPSNGYTNNQNPLSNTLRFSLVFDFDGSGGSTTSTTNQ